MGKTLQTFLAAQPQCKYIMDGKVVVLLPSKGKLVLGFFSEHLIHAQIHLFFGGGRGSDS